MAAAWSAAARISSHSEPAMLSCGCCAAILEVRGPFFQRDMTNSLVRGYCSTVTKRHPLQTEP